MGRPVNVGDFRSIARRRLPRAVFDYVDGAAGDERGTSRNAAALQRILFRPHALTDVSSRDLSVPLFGAALPLPIVIGPTGLNGVVRPGGDLALARAAARAGLPFVLSTASTSSIEEVARACDGEKWFQLYVLERNLAASLARRALDAGFRTLVLTVDVVVGGRRERDMRNGFGVPFRMSARFLADCAMRPAWSLGQLRHGLPQFGNLAGAQAQGASSQALLMQRQMDASFDWDDLKALRDAWPHRLLVKGILRAEDAARCFECGADGVVLSNHGGRQVEDTRAPVDVLAEVAAPEGKAVLVDGGFRRGADIVKALALGAGAVLLGRAPLYGLAAGGEAGVGEVIGILRAEMDNTLALIGCPRADALSREFLDLSRS